MKNRTRKGKSPVRVFLLSALTGVIVVLIILALLSFIITKTDIPMHNLPYYLIAAYAVGAVISAFICARKMQMRGFLSGLTEAALYSLIILLITFILNGYNFSIYLIVMLCVNFLLGTAAGIAAKNIR